MLGSLSHKVAGLKDYSFIKRRLQHRCFPVKFLKFLRTYTQQTLNVDSTLIYVEITSRRRSTWYPRWFNVDLSTLIHRSNSTLKQRWFWVDSKTQFCSYITMLKKLNIYINIEKITVFQRRNNVSLSTLNQRRNFKLKQHWFWVYHKNIFVLIFCSSFDGRIIDVILMHIFNSMCFFWCVFKRKKILVALSFIDKFSIF